MKQPPLISIIIPFFNRATIIQNCLHSLLHQTYTNWEAIVVNDKSTDETENKIKTLCLKDTRIKYLFNNGSKGACACRNLGLHNASGDYIIFLDSDDFLQPFSLQQRLIQIQTNKAFDFIVSRGKVITQQTENAACYWNIKNDLPDARRFIALDSPWQTTGPLWKRQFLIDNNICWDEKLAMWQDVDFHLGALLKSTAYKVFWDEPCDYVVIATSADSLSRTNYYDAEKLNARFYFWEKYAAKAGADISPAWLRPLLLLVCSQAVCRRLWHKAAQIINQAVIKKVITENEFKKLKAAIFLTRISFNRKAFPSAGIANAFKAAPSYLQQIPLDE